MLILTKFLLLTHQNRVPTGIELCRIPRRFGRSLVLNSRNNNNKRRENEALKHGETRETR